MFLNLFEQDVLMLLHLTVHQSHLMLLLPGFPILYL